MLQYFKVKPYFHGYFLVDAHKSFLQTMHPDMQKEAFFQVKSTKWYQNDAWQISLTSITMPVCISSATCSCKDINNTNKRPQLNNTVALQ